jgi:hypothetical protein
MLALLPSSVEERNAYSVVGVPLLSPSLHLRTEAEPASETLLISFFNILIFYSSDDG